MKQASIVEVLNYYGLKLNHNKCLCPFHNDNNPSMVANPKKNIATCFSCGTGGNAISFVQKYEKQINHNDMSINEAISKVVEICNLNIDVSHLNRKKYNTKYSVASRKYTDEEKKLLEVNENLNKLFSYNLLVSKEPKQYLHERKITDKDMKDAKMGFAPKGQLLKISADNKNYPRDALIKLGYLKFNDNAKLYETFSDRVMIPIHDEKGNIVTFCGRTIKDENPKYLHTSETEIFKKKELLYNFYNSKTLAYNNELILVEGYMDVVGARKIGFENVAAIMGTALTPEQIKLIKYNRSTITLALDNDNAGHEAMIKYIPELLKQGFKVNVIDISKIGDYKDFGNLGENDIEFMEVQKAKTSGFSFLLDYKYFKNKDLNVENISNIYKRLKSDKLINNTYDESLYREYILSKTELNKIEFDEIIYPKKIEKKENSINKITSRAMSNFLYTELQKEVEKNNDVILSTYYLENQKLIEDRIVDIFNQNPDLYLNYENSTLNTELLLKDFLANNKSFSDYESLNRFKYNNVFDKTFIKNSSGSARLLLRDEQKQMVIDQFENSLSDESKLALEEVEELYIINSIDDIDGILNYDAGNTLKMLKESLKDRMFLNKDKMDFFKFGNLFPNINKDFIDNSFKGSTGNFKTILFYNNLDNKLNIDKSNIFTSKEEIKENKTNEKDNSISKEIPRDYDFSINKILLVPDMESSTHYFVRIPNTEAKQYFYIPKNECSLSESGETIYTKLKYGETYSIYNSKGDYLFERSFDELKTNWDDKTKDKESSVNGEQQPKEKNIFQKDNIIYDNTYSSKYKEPICKIYHSKIYLETETGFYFRTNDPNVLLFAIKKICNWTSDKSYLIISPRKIFNSGISKYRLQGFKKDYEKKLSFSELSKYIKVFEPKELKNRELITIEVPKENCSFSSNYITIPITLDGVKGQIEVNFVKSKITKDKVILELLKDEQIGFHTLNGEYLCHYSSSKIYDYFNSTIKESNVIQFPSMESSLDNLEKEAA